MRILDFKYRTIWLVLLIYFSCNTAKDNEQFSMANENASEETYSDEPSNSIIGKVLCGYQGWFNTEGDGSDLDWKHYEIADKFEPGYCSIDYWPDMAEFESYEKYATPFNHNDGSQAVVFSSADLKTVNRHFKWMKDYDIDGVFVQRFVSTTKTPKLLDNLNKVFDNCVQGAIENDRLIGLMYDLSGSKAEDVIENVKKDWKQLVDSYKLNDPSNKNLLVHRGKTIISIWGVGFKARDYTLDNIEALIDFFKDDPTYGNCSVLLGVPTGWRTLDRDAIDDPKLHNLIKKADVVHPWTPGRYRNLDEVDLHKTDYTVKDKAWCDQNDLLYMPVVFPGFSWYNLKKGLGEEAELNAIPRLKGDFLWRQFYNAISSDVETIYVAMFDEMDEGTCIFKVADNPPVGESPFLDYEGLPSDYYLWLTGQAGKMLRKEISLSAGQPKYPVN